MVIYEAHTRDGAVYITDQRDALPPHIVTFHKYRMHGNTLEVFYRIRRTLLGASVPYAYLSIGHFEFEKEDDDD